MPMIEVDFATYKEIVARRRSEDMTEGDVIKEAISIFKDADHPSLSTEGEVWMHKGGAFPIGLKLEHSFRDGRTVHATVTKGGVSYDGKVYKDFSPAGVAAAGYQVNGWDFWNYMTDEGHWMPVTAMRV
ncbi:MAG: hypothetical protein V4659_01465 [Pseudomonadota bacterium]